MNAFADPSKSRLTTRLQGNGRVGGQNGRIMLIIPRIRQGRAGSFWRRRKGGGLKNRTAARTTAFLRLFRRNHRWKLCCEDSCSLTFYTHALHGSCWTRRPYPPLVPRIALGKYRFQSLQRSVAHTLPGASRGAPRIYAQQRRLARNACRSWRQIQGLDVGRL